MAWQLTGVIPNLTAQVIFVGADFRALTIITGRQDGYLGIAKVYDKKGIPSICFGSGDTPFEALINLDRQLERRGWRDDKKAEDYMPPKS